MADSTSQIELLLYEIGENIRIYGSVNPSFGGYKMISPYCYKPSVDILLEFSWGFNMIQQSQKQLATNWGYMCIYIYK